LDLAAIAAILAVTRVVAAILANVLGSDDAEEPAAVPAAASAVPANTNAGAAPPVSPGVEGVLATLDPRYRAVLTELLKKRVWSVAEIRELGARTKLMPNGILEEINSWSDEQLGDYLIEESGDWQVRAELLQRVAS
jgi:hypothetical protein